MISTSILSSPIFLISQTVEILLISSLITKLLIFDAFTVKSWLNNVAKYACLLCRIFAWNSCGVRFWTNIMSAGPFEAPLEPFEDIIGQSKDTPGRLRDSTRSFLDSLETSRGMHTEILRPLWHLIPSFGCRKGSSWNNNDSPVSATTQHCAKKDEERS